MPQIKCESKAIIPAQFNVKPIIDSIPIALRQAAIELYADFQSTAATWDHKPQFQVDTQKDSVTVSTNDENWIRVDQGVPRSNKRVMARRRPSGKRFFRIEKRTPKTKPGRIKAGAGSTGEIVYRASYKRGGIQARDFIGQIQAKYVQRYPQLMVAAHGKGVRLGVSDKAREVKVKP